jgi:DNA-binding XRE family transcriptional regulator
MKDLIDNYCRQNNITRQDLAKELQVSRATLYRWTKKQPNAVTKLSKIINNEPKRGV